MYPVYTLGVLLALTSALAWGGGDFCGGVATRRNHQFQVLTLSAFSGTLVLIVLVLLRDEPSLSTGNVMLAALAGVSGGLGIAALYRALSIDKAATVAPTAAVVGAAFPAVFSSITEGFPGVMRFIGLGLALIGIWFLSASAAQTQGSKKGFLIALFAGMGFACFFILIAQVEVGALMTTLLAARCASLGMALILLRALRLSLPSLTSSPIALVAGVLDAGGNIFYLLAKQFTRLDVAVVLSSLYPLATVILARLILHERISRKQLIGAALCLLAIVLIAVGE